MYFPLPNNYLKRKLQETCKALSKLFAFEQISVSHTSCGPVQTTIPLFPGFANSRQGSASRFPSDHFSASATAGVMLRDAVEASKPTVVSVDRSCPHQCYCLQHKSIYTMSLTSLRVSMYTPHQMNINGSECLARYHSYEHITVK